MKAALKRLFQLRTALDDCEKEFGLDAFSEVEKAVFSFVTSSSHATITSIKNDPYFSRYSLSTIKRAVIFLSSEGMIRSSQSHDDKREVLLTFGKSI